MSKCKGTPKKNLNPGWKSRAQAIRREAAESRQRAYDALPESEEVKRNPRRGNDSRTENMA